MVLDAFNVGSHGRAKMRQSSAEAEAVPEQTLQRVRRTMGLSYFG